MNNNNVVIWMDIPLFTSPFFGDSYCLYPFWKSSHSKTLSFVCKKQHGFVVYSVTCRMRPRPTKKRRKKNRANCFFEFWRSLLRAATHIVTYLSSNVANLAIGFLEKINLFFINVNACFVENVAVSV